MTVRLNPYLAFRDNAREAMTFYQSVFGGELTFSTFGETPMPGIGPELADKIMHSMLQLEGGNLTLMAADIPPHMDGPLTNHAIALFGDEEPVLRGWWDGLIVGGTATMPLEVAPWGDAFGQLTDRFGVAWMVNITGGGS
jgi:PhnB protein